jgi:hypothetical protein
VPTPTYVDVIGRGVAAIDAMMLGTGDCRAVTAAVVLAANLRAGTRSSGGPINRFAVAEAYADMLQVYGQRLAARLGAPLDALSPGAALEVEQAIADAIVQARKSFGIALAGML